MRALSPYQDWAWRHGPSLFQRILSRSAVLRTIRRLTRQLVAFFRGAAIMIGPEYEFHRCSRKCAATGREIKPGELFYSALIERPAGLERIDFGVDDWQGPPADAIGWWKSRLPDNSTSHQPCLAPNDQMLNLVEQWEDAADSVELRYLITLLLIRRRVLRHEETEHDEGGENMIVYCPRREKTYRVRVASLNEDRIETIEESLVELLFPELVVT